MAQIYKMETKAEITCPSVKVYDFFKYNLTNMVNVLPQVYKSVQVIEGEAGQVGNVMLMEYVLGKTMSVKLRATELNDREKSLTFRILEGDVLELYSNFTLMITVADGCVTWYFEFEKNNESVPNPDIYSKLLVKVTKIVNLHLLNN